MTAPTIPDVRELDVQSIAAGGDGVGRSSGLVVFVPRTALTSLTVLGVIGGLQARRRKVDDTRQVTLFSE